MATLSPTEKKLVKKMFDEVDKDKDGKINKAEIKYLISSMNQTGGEDLLDGVFKFLDKDGNHSIDFEEFVKFYQANFEIPTDVVMRSFFRSFDINGDGVLSKIELKEALKKMRAPMNEDIIDLMFAGVDMNRDGTISYEEFIKMMKD